MISTLFIVLFWRVVAIVTVSLSLSYTYEYLFKYKSLKSIPGPFLAKISKFWLFRQALKDTSVTGVQNLHRKYGKLVRLEPNHVSIDDLEAMSQIYSYGNGMEKP